MMRSITAISALALLTACGDGNPFCDLDDPDNLYCGTDEGEAPDVEIELDGTEDPSASRSISRIEPGTVTEDGRLIANDTFGGLVREVIYDEDSDTYTIDNLAFDGENEYETSSVFPTLGGYPIYEAAEEVPDFLTSAAVGQIVPYVAVTGRSEVINPEGADGEFEPRATFAIVRTGGYTDYGFGGFVYARNGDVTLPTAGQAQFDGTYAGVRVFDKEATLEYTTGNVEVGFDFDDFNLNNGVKGTVSDRELFDENGNPIPGFFVSDDLLPDLNFVVVQGVDTLLPTGELSGDLLSRRLNDNGEIAIYEEGKYYAIIAGDSTAGDGGELVGVFVVESEDPRVDNLFVQETGGFILQRSQP